MNITAVGIDLAKDVITVYAQDGQGRCVMSRNFRFKELSEWLVQLPAGCLIGMEACSTAHYWGCRMQAMGFQPRLMAAEFVQAFRKSKSAKNDHNDAEAIAIAVRQPTMRFVAIKNESQQSRLAWHRVREGWKEESIALINRCRGLLLEFGYPLARSAAAFQRGLKIGLQEQSLPSNLRRLLGQIDTQLGQLDQQLALCDREIAQAVREDEAYLRSLLVQGARSTLQLNRTQQWIIRVYGRVGYHKTLVAIANKHARQLWALLAKGETYDLNAWQQYAIGEPS